VSAALAAIGGVLISAFASILAIQYQHQVTERNEHKRQALERHLSHYERIFVSARSVQDAVRDYRTVSDRVTDRSDPFLRQLLAIVSKSAYDYFFEVDWRHNPGMAYLDLKLEGKCMRARDLLIQWLSRPRIATGDIASVRVAGRFTRRSLSSVQSLKVGDYEELRIERQLLVTPAAGDTRLLAELDTAFTAVIVELKAVMAY